MRLLYRVYWKEPSGTGPADFDDWGDISGADLRAAVRWADQTGVSCASSFNPSDPPTRRTAAKWIRRAQLASVSCSGTETD